MKTFSVHYEDAQGRHWTTQVEAWDREQAATIFQRDNPGTRLLGVNGASVSARHRRATLPPCDHEECPPTHCKLATPSDTRLLKRCLEALEQLRAKLRERLAQPETALTHPLCRFCTSRAQLGFPSFIPDAWCYRFRSGEHVLPGGQGWCAQFHQDKDAILGALEQEEGLSGGGAGKSTRGACAPREQEQSSITL